LFGADPVTMNTILLIDDEEGLRTIYKTALQNHGYRVIEAASGNAGFELAQKHLPDLILTDISMPNGDGQAVLKKIRQDPALSSKQVVLMTGNVNQITPRKGMEAGADDFLVKPVDLQALLSCVEARLKRAQIHWRVEDRMLAQLCASLHSTLPHEFFTPLAGIIGLSEILCSDSTELSPEEVRDLHNDIHHSALRLHRTLKNYLLILEFEAGSSEAERLPAPLLSPVLKENIGFAVQGAIRGTNRKEDIVVQVEECSIWARATDLSLIVEELVDNACKFSRQGTSILVHFGANGILTVTDAGRGMTPEEIRQIGAFQQFDRKKHEQQGLGLGLVLVQKLAARSGAKLSIESQSSQGTQMKVAFQTGASDR
jgi:two-component system sensor histidine kinase/response regulator